ncbi:MAG: thioredoxin family protein [Verrucomicrobiota bacterium]
MTLPFRLFFLVLFGLFPSLLTANDGPWKPGFQAASSEATKTGKDIIIIFTIQQWNAACRQFQKHFLLQPAFADDLQDQFLLVWVDASEKGGDKEDSPAFTLRKRYGISSFPSVILTNAIGQPYAFTGFRPGSLESYIRHLRALKEAQSGRQGLLSEARNARGLSRAALLARAIPDLGSQRTAKFYGDVMREVLSLDPQGRNPETESVRLSLAELDYTQQLQALDQDFQWTEMVALTRTFIEENGLSGGQKQSALMNLLQIQRRQGNLQGSVKTLQDIIFINPYNKHGQQATMILGKIQSELEQTAILADPEIDESE